MQGVLLPAQTVGQFDVLETYHATPSPGDQLVAADPSRVAILFDGGSRVSTLQTPPAGVPLGGQWGIGLASGGAQNTLGHSIVGPLASQAWFCSVAAGTSVTVIEVFLRRDLNNQFPG